MYNNVCFSLACPWSLVLVDRSVGRLNIDLGSGVETVQSHHCLEYKEMKIKYSCGFSHGEVSLLSFCAVGFCARLYLVACLLYQGV
jgi:hypothetical protein